MFRIRSLFVETKLETGRGVMYMGGFNGGDPVVDAGELRYILADEGGRGGPGRGANSDVSEWLTASCTIVTEIETNSTLYDCAR